MKIEEILKGAGIEDAEIIEKVKAAMPENFLPLAEHNKRIAAAKTEAEKAASDFEAYKKQVEEEAAHKAEELAKEAEAHAKALEALQAEKDELSGKVEEKENAIRARDAKEALSAAIKSAGANAAAVPLLTEKALKAVEYGEDGKPANIDTLTEQLKEENGGLFGEAVDTGKEPTKASRENGVNDPFLKGFAQAN